MEDKGDSLEHQVPALGFCRSIRVLAPKDNFLDPVFAISPQIGAQFSQRFGQDAAFAV